MSVLIYNTTSTNLMLNQINKQIEMNMSGMMPKPSQTIMEFYIFNRSGTCLYSQDLVTKQVNSVDNDAVQK